MFSLSHWHENAIADQIQAPQVKPLSRDLAHAED